MTRPRNLSSESLAAHRWRASSSFVWATGQAAMTASLTWVASVRSSVFSTAVPVQPPSSSVNALMVPTVVRDFIGWPFICGCCSAEEEVDLCQRLRVDPAIAREKKAAHAGRLLGRRAARLLDADLEHV